MALAAFFLAASLAALQSGPDPLARWAFDGDVKDSGPTAFPTKAVGRLDFMDSPIGGSGKAAVFNGVDAFVQVEPEGTLGAGAADFAVSAWVFALEKRTATLLARKGWSLVLTDAGALQFVSDAGTFATSAGACPPAQWNHVAFWIRRRTDEKMCAILVNGYVAGSGSVGAGNFDEPKAPLLMGRGLAEGKLFAGFLDDVRITVRPYGHDDAVRETDRGLPWARLKPHAKTPFGGKFELLKDDVVASVGGENARVGGDLGYLETLLTLRTPGTSVRFRNMAWEGDTVYEQPRPLNFGSWTDQFRRTGTTVIFVQFGQIESLEGKAGLERFVEAYENLLNQFTAATKRIVLVSPTPFGKGSAHQPDLAARNEDLKLYVDAIRALAGKRGCLFVDLSTKALADNRLTRDGLHLTTAGQWIAARETLRQLEVAGVSDLDEPNPQGAFPGETYEKVRGTIRTKNALWNDSWRPANWAFLYGDRMEQPSSRDHVDRRVRWFPVEIQQLPALMRREEEKIQTLLQTSEKK